MIPLASTLATLSDPRIGGAWLRVVSNKMTHCCHEKQGANSITVENLIRADGSTQIGQQLASYNWGSASSQPAGVHDGLCSI